MEKTAIETQHVEQEPSPTKKRGHKKGCVFSETNIDLHGVNSTLSVYDASTHLEFIALDQEGWSNKSPVVLSIRQLRERFEDQPQLLEPTSTKELVLALLPDLFYIQAEKFIQLSYRRGGPVAGDVLADAQPLEAGELGDKIAGKFELGGVPATYDITETKGARQFWIMNLDVNGKPYEHTVAVAEFSALKRQMLSRCNLSFVSFISRKRKWAAQLVTCFAPGAQDQPPTFNGQALRKFEEIAKELAPKKNAKKANPVNAAPNLAASVTKAKSSTKKSLKLTGTNNYENDDFETEKDDDAEEVIIETEHVDM